MQVVLKERVYDGEIFKLDNMSRDYFIQLKEWASMFLIHKKKLMMLVKKLLTSKKFKMDTLDPLSGEGSEMMAISHKKIKFMLRL